MSCRRTSTWGATPSIQPVSMSVARTWPSGRARPASQFGTEGPPAPTSQHRQPALDAERLDVPERDVIEKCRQRAEPPLGCRGAVV
jgi:hypothetical protein